MFDDGMFSSSDSISLFSDSDHFCSINPASGLPMMGDDIYGLDVAGNPWGCDDSLFESSSIDSSFDW